MNCEYNLYEHQIETINWMNTIKNTNINGSKGGIVFLEMGLGKTLLSLEYLRNNLIKNEPNLIICSKTLINEWINQINKFYEEDTFKYLILHNTNKIAKKITLNELKEYDVIITTYNTIVHIDKELEFSKTYFIKENMNNNKLKIKKNNNKLRKNNSNLLGLQLLYSIQFNNIICDEIQNITNFKTKSFKSIYSLAFNYKFGLSGTPIRNNRNDLISLFKYINMNNYDYPYSWNSIKNIPIEHFNTIKSVKYINTNITLPNIKYEQFILTMDQDSIDIYKTYVNKLQIEYNKFLNKRTEFSALIGLFTRLRQICLSINLLSLTNLSITQFKKTLKTENIEILNKFKNVKYKKILQIIKKCNKNKEKLIIFSSFSSYLSILKDKLIQDKYESTMLESKHKMNERNNLIQNWKNSSTNNILLLNYKLGAEGLNLIEANNIILMDTWWNNAIESQAIARINRIGQTKEMNVYRLIMKNTIEELILQKSKSKIDLFDKFKYNQEIKEVKISKKNIELLMNELQMNEMFNSLTI